MLEETGPPQYRQNTPAERVPRKPGENLERQTASPQYFETVSFFCGLHPTLNILLLSSIRMLQVIVEMLVWKLPFHRAFYVAYDA